MNQYSIERDGQIDFYNRFLMRIDPSLTIDEILEDNNDGVINGNLLEFKLNINDLNTVLFQCIKYLSSLRIKGKPIPAGIVIIDLNVSTAWYYESNVYIKYIENLYFGAASKDNSGFIGESAKYKLHYEENSIDTEKLISLLKENNYTKIHIDENCIVGWATSFYKATPNARKEDFIGDERGKHKTIGEIRNPKVFKDFILPYTGETNGNWDKIITIITREYWSKLYKSRENTLRVLISR